MKSWEDVDKMSNEALRTGKYKDPFQNNEGKSPGDFPVLAEDYLGNSKGLLTIVDWKNECIKIAKMAQEVLDGTREPKWSDLTYRSEKDFRAGSFSNYIENWPIFINHLETDKLKSLAYKIITSGLNISDNQDKIEIKDRIKFRNKTWLCTTTKENDEYESLIKKGCKTIVAKDLEYIQIGTNLYPRKTHYHVEAKRLGKTGKFKKQKFFQPNQIRILDNPQEMQDQINKWCKQGVLRHLGPENRVESDVRTSLVLAYHEVKQVYRICYDGGPSKVTQKFNVDCKLDSIYDAINLLEKGDHLSKLDDKSGFLQIKFDRSSRNLSHVKWGKEIFEFYGAIFGVSRVPSDFQLINSCVVSFLRNQGIPLTLYLDDRLVIEKGLTKKQLLQIRKGDLAPRNVWLTHAFIIISGGYISKKKSTFVCETRLEFLGFILDTEKQTVEIPPEKWERVQKTIENILHNKEVDFKTLEKLQGTLCSFLVVITNMQLYIRRITETMKRMQQNNQLKTKVDERLEDELEIWRNLKRNAIKLERPWLKPEPTIVETRISTDASTSNGGWVEADGTERTIPWTVEEAPLHITLKEAIIIKKYLQQNKIKSQNQRITFLCDNEGVVKTFEKGSKDPKLNDEIRAIRLLGCEINALLSIEWVSTSIQEADKASRTIDIREEILVKEVFVKLQELANNCCKIDLCATFANKKCDRYYSRFNEEQAEGKNAFSYSGKEFVYAFPPKSIVNPLFIKLIKQKTPFIGIYHTYQEQPAWMGLAPKSSVKLKLDYNWLVMNGINRKSPTLIPCKKRKTPEGFYEAPNSNLEISAIIIQSY